MAAVLELLLQEEVAVGAVVRWAEPAGSSALPGPGGRGLRRAVTAGLRLRRRRRRGGSGWSGALRRDGGASVPWLSGASGRPEGGREGGRGGQLAP
uniref:Uncharacterized protein n=1 Tax=Accipiter nisus TaxID=211598 RepID=A0A8B9NJ60_9AVES